MGLYEGGLLMTLLYVVVIAFFATTGILAERNPGAIDSISTIPNTGNITQYAGIDNNTTGNGVQQPNSSTINITTTQNDIAGSITGILSITGQSLIQVPLLLKLMIGGWVIILGIILGNGPLAFLIFLIGVPLQLLQVYFILQISLQLLGAFTGGGQVK